MPDIWLDVDVALAEVPVNILPLLDDTDFKTRETGITYDQAGMDLVWNFITPAGAFTQTPVTPTTGGNYDWTNQGDGMYTIEIPDSGGASINNDTEGFGWFTGVCTGVLPWRGPVIGFRAAGLNDKMIESAYDTTRGLAGTALPGAAADAAGGLPISDAGGLDLDAQVKTDVDNLVSRLGTPVDLGSGASVAANLQDVEGQTDDIGAAGAGLTAVPWNAAWDAEVQSEVADALDAAVPGVPTANSINERIKTMDDADLPGDTANIEADTQDIQSRLPATLVGGRMDSDIGAKTGNVALSAQEKLDVNAEVDTALNTAVPGVPTADSLNERIKTMDDADLPGKIGTPSDLGSGATVAANLADIEGQTDDIGAAGAGLSAVPWNAAWDAEVESEMDDALVAQRLDELVGATAGGVDPVAGSVMDQVMNKDAGQTFDQSTDSLEALKDGASAPTAAEVADAVLEEVVGEHPGEDTVAGFLRAAATPTRRV